MNKQLACHFCGVKNLVVGTLEENGHLQPCCPGCAFPDQRPLMKILKPLFDEGGFL